nr:hypothetical protein [Micromonospora sp. DSM 115978]
MMTSSEIARLRRQMHQRIREVVAERRLARQHQTAAGDRGDATAQHAPQQSEGALIGG